jgi:hypothetical protein
MPVDVDKSNAFSIEYGYLELSIPHYDTLFRPVYRQCVY